MIVDIQHFSSSLPLSFSLCAHCTWLQRVSRLDGRHQACSLFPKPYFLFLALCIMMSLGVLSSSCVVHHRGLSTSLSFCHRLFIITIIPFVCFLSVSLSSSSLSSFWSSFPLGVWPSLLLLLCLPVSWLCTVNRLITTFVLLFLNIFFFFSITVLYPPLLPSSFFLLCAFSIFFLYTPPGGGEAV